MPNFEVNDKPEVVTPATGDYLLIELDGQPGVYRKVPLGDLVGGGFVTGVQSISVNGNTGLKTLTSNGINLFNGYQTLTPDP